MAYKVLSEGMNGTLICNSMVVFYLRRRMADACIIEATQVCTNCDMANKVGIYTHAIISREMGVKFLMASWFTTLDLNLLCGDVIKIDEHPPGEMLESACAPIMESRF